MVPYQVQPLSLTCGPATSIASQLEHSMTRFAQPPQMRR